MSVHQTPDGRWYCQYRATGQKSKKREYFGRGAIGRAAAYNRDDEIKAERAITAARRKSASGPTFSGLANAYTQSRVGSMTDLSMGILLRRLRSTIFPKLGHLYAQEITPERLDEYVRARLQTVKASTICRELSDILAIMNWAARRKIIQANPCARYRKPNPDYAIIQPPTLDETRRILDHAPDHLKRIILLSLYIGLRPGMSELYRLRWSAVDWEQRTILVVSAKKGGRVSRNVPLHPFLLNRMRQWYAIDGRSPERHIITFRGRPIKDAIKAFRRARKAAGIQRRLTLYSFRHAFATLALAHGADLRSTSEIMGHSSPDITMRIYQHVSMDQYRSAVESIPAIDDDNP